VKILKRIKDSLIEQLSVSKMILKNKWDVGADQGKKLKEKQKNIIKRKVKK